MRWFTLSLAGLAAVAAGFSFVPWTGSTQAESAVAPRTLAEQLRYVGRDTSTGMAAPVNDRFIAATELAIERYGKDESQAVPPPAVDGADIATVELPTLGVKASVERFGLDRFGRLDVPQDRVTVGWHPAYSDRPGESGATFLAAHYQYAGQPGVFHDLSALKAGDEFTLVLTDGSRHGYEVTSTVEYALGTIDMGALLHGREGVESVTLMTCSGPANEGEYAFRTVVLAKLAG